MPNGTPEGQAQVPRLDPVDRRLLELLDRDPVGGLSEFADRLGISPRTVARRLTRLQRAGVVRVIGRTLPGFGGRLVRLTRAHGPREAVANIASMLAQRPHTRWVRLSRDGTEFICGSVTAPAQSDDALRTLTDDPRLSWVQVHELMQVWGGELQAVTTPPRDLDSTDERLLHLLEHDGRMDSAEIARHLRTDRSTASRRRRRLVDEGVLYFEADIHPSVLGSYGDMFVWIRMEPGRITELGQALRRLPEVRFSAATTGEKNLAAHVVLPDSRSMVTFLDHHMHGYGVNDVEVVPMGRVLKRSR